MFLDEVFVPDNHLVGEAGGGWSVAGSTLTHERGVNPRQLVIHSQLVEELVHLAAERGGFEDWRLRQQLAESYLEVRLFQILNWRSLSRLAKGQALGPESSTLKLYWSEMSKRLHHHAMEMLGDAAALVVGRGRQPRERGLAALVALLPGRIDLRRHERDPAQPGG